MSSSATNRTIYVSNIPNYFTEPVIAAFFKSCGTITNLKMAGNVDQPTRYAFVEFSDPKAANTALTLSGTDIQGRKLKITMSHSAITSPPSTHLRMDGGIPRNTSYTRESGSSPNSSNTTPPIAPDAVERTIYVTSIDTQISEQQLVDIFSYCGHINNHRLCGDESHPTRFAFFEFSTREAAVAALNMNGTSLGRYNIKVSHSRSPIQPGSGSSYKAINYNTPQYQDQIARTVYVGGVDVSIAEDDLHEFFQQSCGPVAKVALAGDSDHAARFAFIEFADTDGRNKALKSSGALLAGKAIRVSASRTPILNGGKTYPSSDNNTATNQLSSDMGHYPPPPTAKSHQIQPNISTHNEEEENRNSGRSDDDDERKLKRKRSPDDPLYHSDDDNEAKRPRYSHDDYNPSYNYNYYHTEQAEEQGM